MLNKKRTAGWARLKLLVAFPLMGGMLCMSTMAFTKDYGYVDLLPEKSSTILSMIQDPPKVENVKRLEPVKVENVKRLQAVKKDKIKFPPPHILPDFQDHFYPMFTKDAKSKAIKSVERRYIVINGKKIDGMASFYGVKNTKKIVYLTGKQAIQKYGQAGKFGAVEITGTNIQWLKFSEMPPPPLVDVVRFPPPKLKFKTVDSVSIRNVKLDSIKTLNIKLKPTLKFKTVTPLKTRTVPLKTRTVTSLRLNVVPSVKKSDTLTLIVSNEMRIKPPVPLNLQVKREVNRNVNMQIDSIANRKANRNIEVQIKKPEPLKLTEVQIQSPTKN
jgi:hypothetical protein